MDADIFIFTDCAIMSVFTSGNMLVFVSFCCLIKVSKSIVAFVFFFL